MSEKCGIKEIYDMLVAIETIALAFIYRIKDGFTAWDMIGITKDSIGAFREAWSGREDIPAEFKDLDEDEIKKLFDKLIDMAMNIAKAFGVNTDKIFAEIRYE